MLCRIRSFRIVRSGFDRKRSRSVSLLWRGRFVKKPWLPRLPVATSLVDLGIQSILFTGWSRNPEQPLHWLISESGAACSLVDLGIRSSLCCHLTNAVLWLFIIVLCWPPVDLGLGLGPQDILAHCLLILNLLLQYKDDLLRSSFLLFFY